MHLIQKVLLVVGGIAVVVGALWMGQGAGIIPGSFMSGDRTWLGIGLAVAAVGLVLVYVGLQRPRPTWAAGRRARPSADEEPTPNRTRPEGEES